MGHHLTSTGVFKSDKYAWCPEGFFALKFTDPIARSAALFYAKQTQDDELAGDLRTACAVVEGKDGDDHA